MGGAGYRRALYRSPAGPDDPCASELPVGQGQEDLYVIEYVLYIGRRSITCR